MSVKAHGGGLINGIAGMANKFTVFTSGKNVTGLTVAFEGQSDAFLELAWTDRGEGDLLLLDKKVSLYRFVEPQG